MVIFIARNWLIARISKSVQHGFDVKIEDVRAELRRNEEKFKSDLRDKESEISILRNNVLSGRAGRQSLLDRRRFEAVERVWTAVNDMARYKALASMMAVLKFKEVAKRAKDPGMQQFLGVVESVAPKAKEFKNVARDEQPFLPELAWAYFSAYTTILISSFLRFQVLKIGLDDPDELMSNTSTQKILKAALPQFGEFIEKNQPETYYYLLDEIERSLLLELRKILEGKDADHATVARAKEIMDAVKQADAERAKAAAVGLQDGG